jgi:hypothetical protein
MAGLAGALVLPAAAARAADIPPAVLSAARCATHAATEAEAANAMRIIGSQDTAIRTLFGARDLVIVNAGTSRGVAVNQQFFIRTHDTFRSRKPLEARPVDTAGWLRIVAANENTSIAQVEYACGGIMTGDYLEPYLEPTLPADLSKADTSGTLDFAMPEAVRVLFGERERWTGATGDFMVVDAGVGRGAEPGVRYAIFRDVGLSGVPLTPVGEAIVVRADANTAVVRVTQSRDVIQRGDLLIPRKAR